MILRKTTTDFLSKLLCKEKLIGKHYAREVTVDYGTGKAKRVDFMQFVPDCYNVRVRQRVIDRY